MERRFERSRRAPHRIRMICGEMIVKIAGFMAILGKYSLANLKHNLLQEIGELLNDRHGLARSQADAIHRRRCVVSAWKKSNN
jgi:hypothetical protein